MFRSVILAALFAAFPFGVHAQEMGAEPPSAGAKTEVAEQNDDPAERKAIKEPAIVHDTVTPAPSAEAKPAGVNIPTDFGYRRPDAERRFKLYLNNIAGPLSLSYQIGTAGLLTLRNSPKEWGDRTDGFMRRLGNVAAKNAIRSTTIYALDEALKVDSTFYRSRDRRVVARLRNVVFSSVTARNSKGKRVIGIPAIAGGLLSEVASSSGWYPNRYDYVHGLKGGAISLGVAAGLNLIREFIRKP